MKDQNLDLNHSNISLSLKSDKAWETAIIVYPDLVPLCEHLSTISQKLSSDFITYLLTSKKFKDRYSLAQQMANEFIPKLCGENTELLDYIFSLKKQNFDLAVRRLVEYIEVVGPDTDIKLIQSLIENDFPNILIFGSESNKSSLRKVSEISISETEKITPTSQAMDKLTIIKNSLFGKFYISYLKPIPLVRNLMFWLWRTGYPFYLNHISLFFQNKQTHKLRSLVTINHFISQMNISTIHLLNAETILTPIPEHFSNSKKDVLVSPHDQYTFPDILLTTIKNGMVYGGTNLTLLEEEVICHDLYNFETDYTSEELHHRTLINPRKNQIRWLLHDSSPQKILTAAAFTDACAPNYAHWLTEVLPKIALFCSRSEFKSIPIIINDDLHENIMESLSYIVQDREVIKLPIGYGIMVEELLLISATGYVPFDRRSEAIALKSHGQFSAQSFQILRQQVANIPVSLIKDSWPEKIYIRRNSGIRKVTNSQEVEKFLKSQEYVVVEPEKLSFSQQVQLFAHAKSIVASSGAALANLIFLPENAEIIVLIGEYPNTSYWYWQNMACASGNVIKYVFGKILSKSAGIHADFEINIDDLKSSLNNRK